MASGVHQAQASEADVDKLSNILGMDRSRLVHLTDYPNRGYSVYGLYFLTCLPPLFASSASSNVLEPPAASGRLLMMIARPSMPPKEPLIYRLYEIVQNYGSSYKAVMNEKFGQLHQFPYSSAPTDGPR